MSFVFECEGLKCIMPCWGAKMCCIVMCFSVMISILCIHCIVHMYICKCVVPWWKGKSHCIHLSAHIVPSDQTSWDLFLTNICDWIRWICKSDIWTSINKLFLGVGDLFMVQLILILQKNIEKNIDGGAQGTSSIKITPNHGSGYLWNVYIYIESLLHICLDF